MEINVLKVAAAGFVAMGFWYGDFALRVAMLGAAILFYDLENLKEEQSYLTRVSLEVISSNVRKLIDAQDTITAKMTDIFERLGVTNKKPTRKTKVQE